MKVLKHIARDYDVNPYDLRCALRAAGLKPTEKRWKWPDENDPGYKAASDVAQKLKSKKLGKSTST